MASTELVRLIECEKRAVARQGYRDTQAAIRYDFAVVDPSVPAGGPGSAEEPSPYVPLADFTEAIAGMQGAEVVLIPHRRARILYDYPLDSAGPTACERLLNGWVFEEEAPNGRHFTRADLVRVIGARYAAIYDEERATSSFAERFIARSANRAESDGKYRIYGHVLGDLLLRSVLLDPQHGVYTLGIDS